MPIKRITEYGKSAYMAVSFTADDWCFWPVMFLQFSSLFPVKMLGVQWLKWGVGIAVRKGGDSNG